MKDKETVTKGPKRRDPTCYQTQQDIVVPKGTILRGFPDLGPGKFGALVAHGDFVILQARAEDYPELYKKVVA